MDEESNSDPSNPTTELLDLCQCSGWQPDVLEVKRLVCDGADIFTKNPHTGNSVLTELTLNNQVGVVLCCLLENPQPLNLNVKEGEWERTYLHIYCDYKVEVENSVAILKAIIQRFSDKSTYPEDVALDWTVKDKWGIDALEMIAYRCRLSALWPLLRHFSYFQERIDNAIANADEEEGKNRPPLIPRHFIYDEDFDLLSHEEQCELL